MGTVPCLTYTASEPRGPERPALVSVSFCSRSSKARGGSASCLSSLGCRWQSLGPVRLCQSPAGSFSSAALLPKFGSTEDYSKLGLSDLEFSCISSSPSLLAF